ncbi:UBP-type zinc finger domain-containing protein [Streptomyces pseudogriseolus]|uniref:UBP-type domain-containing protein n=4 Tax=Streptomyces TaxID=1883 RepID=M3DMZ4_STREZ|nr:MULTISPECIES: UBP-type zinc finger domain-containing protein [Streptomyces]MCM3300971.1 UBP-type zinc finger domain-containing protein [Streptomyces pseudogriseolus]GGP89702.1 hypothetical protein GCM10010233_01640 [Streptomyces gancidicus]EMF22616.1 hypothetical protein H114_30247 [Streptomyces gancidicus BKS 13-15]MCI4141390.1 UBP-type zinc finger domain-containing protein [Streptomyces sp. MMS20-AI2-20]GGS31842.1 hypothetical protein GCM10010285_07980 [Streptomyces rubiginosus]
MKQCTHVEALPHPDPVPLGETCPECLRDGTDPVQLRLCLTCGHVGCCDSSPNRHATEHHKETGHPVMRTHEPGEDWRWCFVDHVLV